MTITKLNFPEFEVQGVWYLPTNPDHKVVGILRFSPGSIPKLKLVGNLIEPIEGTVEEKLEKAFGKENIPIVLGVLTNGETIGEKVTLYKNVLYGEGITTGVIETKCIPAFILRGFHFHSEEDIRFDNVYFHFSNLEQWLRINNIKSTVQLDTSHKNIEDFTVQYQPLIRKTLANLEILDFGIKDKPLNLSGLGMAKFFNQHISEITIFEDKVFELNSSEVKDLDTYLEDIFKIQDFLVFATGQATNLTEVGTLFRTKVKTQRVESDIQSLSETIPQITENIVFKNEYFSITHPTNVNVIEEEIENIFPIKIYFYTSVPNSEEKFDTDKVLFYFSDVEDIFESVFLKWYTESQKIKPVINLYLGLFYLPKRYLTERFLTLAQALEAFHRILHGGRYIEKEEYEKGILQSLLKAIDSDSSVYNLSPEFTSSLKQKLSYLYEFSLRKRIKALIRDNETSFPKEFLTTKALRENFIDTVVIIRNKLTHLDEDTDIQSIIEPRQLNILCNSVEVLLRCCIMRFLGVKDEVIKRRIKELLIKQQ